MVIYLVLKCPDGYMIPMVQKNNIYCKNMDQCLCVCALVIVLVFHLFFKIKIWDKRRGKCVHCEILQVCVWICLCIYKYSTPMDIGILIFWTSPSEMRSHTHKNAHVRTLSASKINKTIQKQTIHQWLKSGTFIIQNFMQLLQRMPSGRMVARYDKFHWNQPKMMD